ncbi:hypothetical protein SDC9_45668 [bioreactor metagenome]|uniref:DUF1097 domain-containing protein n=1 Tax=bioreactor metagenome TaxID=1076179 RepID=A0A644W7J7_9ZZZZ
MNKTIAGIIAGTIAGIIDLVPMIIQNLTWDANLAAFSMWFAAGILTAHNDMKVHPLMKGLITAFLCLLPSAFIIGWTMPESLIGVFGMTIILGLLIGWLANKLQKHKA